MSQIPEFAGRALNLWARDELEKLAKSRRRDPPKVRALIDWMLEHGVESMADLSDAALLAAAQDLDMTVFGSVIDVSTQKSGPTLPNSDPEVGVRD